MLTIMEDTQALSNIDNTIVFLAWLTMVGVASHGARSAKVDFRSKLCVLHPRIDMDLQPDFCNG